MFDLIPLAIAACGQELIFPNASVATEFMRMLSQQIPPEQFVDYISANTPDPGAVREATRLVLSCLGQPS